ncbi:MAG: hypothetical protein KC680_04625, partial [Candidatus Peregrinibacteria bacterium]|nr:hypothetical protein [Candidatus Peregrinibacteria bacterium]
MKFFEAFQQRQHLWCTLCDWAIIVLVILSIVWRGGKSLDMTWILIGVVSIATITYHLRFSTREKSGIPAYLWYAVITFIAITVLSFVYSTTRNYGFDEVL